MGGLLKSGIAAGAAPVLITAPLTLALACEPAEWHTPENGSRSRYPDGSYAAPKRVTEDRCLDLRDGKLEPMYEYRILNRRVGRYEGGIVRGLNKFNPFEGIPLCYGRWPGG